MLKLKNTLPEEHVKHTKKDATNKQTHTQHAKVSVMGGREEEEIDYTCDKVSEAKNNTAVLCVEREKKCSVRYLPMHTHNRKRSER